MRNRLASSAIAVAILGFTPGLTMGSVLYATGFEQPSFVAAPLPGQDGWFAGLGQNAASISSEIVRHGSQAVRIDGAALEEFFGFHFGSYARMLDYNPVGSATPIVELTGAINLSGVAASCGLGIGISAVLNGDFVANILIGVREQDGNFVSYMSNMDGVFVNGAEYFLDQWADLTAVFNFENRTARGFFNGQFMGEIPFTTGIDTTIPAINIFLGSSQPIPNAVGYIDDFSINAAPEPSTLSLLISSLLALLIFPRCRYVPIKIERPSVSGVNSTPRQ